MVLNERLIRSNDHKPTQFSRNEKQTPFFHPQFTVIAVMNWLRVEADPECVEGWGKAPKWRGGMTDRKGLHDFQKKPQK